MLVSQRDNAASAAQRFSDASAPMAMTLAWRFTIMSSGRNVFASADRYRAFNHRMSLLGHALFAASLTRGHLLERRTGDPRPSQTATLLSLVRRAERTAFGRAHGFDAIRSVAQFRARVPLQDYAGLAPWLRRAFDGEPDVVWPGRVPYFGMSSGTTGGNKYLPISLDSVRRQQRGGFEPIAAYLRAGGARDVLDGRAILLGSSPELELRANGVQVGDNTGIMARHIPRWVRRKHLPSPRVRALASWDAKIEALAEEALGEDVRLIAGTPAWFPGLFDAVLRAARARDLPARHLLDVWPKLRLLTGGGVRYAPYRPLIEARLGGAVPYFDVYNATEGGIMGVQDALNDPAMLLLPDNGVFYEFIPVEQLEHTAPDRLPLWEVAAGRVYALALSTPSGLFAYLLGDCLRFVSTFPHRFVFEGRSSAFLNVCGEHVSQAELERAVTRACAEQGVQLANFSVSPRVPAGAISAEHVYYVECEGRLPDPARLANTIDATIARGNDDYGVHRGASAGLAPPRVELLTGGTFHRFMRARGKLGGQHKPPRLIEDAQLLAVLLEHSGREPSRWGSQP